MTVARENVFAWFDALEQVYEQNQERLTELDSAIGDADHGTNMARGFAAVNAELTARPPAGIRAIFETAAKTLIRTVGGSAGPLYGTFFLRAAAVSTGKTVLDAADVLAFFQAGIEGVQQRGKAGAGDKTMLDALLPALDAMRRGVEAGEGLEAVLKEAAAAAEAGMQATIPMQARKGRASYLGARSVGHPDPGATSSWLLVQAAADTWHA